MLEALGDTIYDIGEIQQYTGYVIVPPGLSYNQFTVCTLCLYDTRLARACLELSSDSIISRQFQTFAMHSLKE